MKYIVMTALLGGGLLACGGTIDTVEECLDEDGGIVQQPPGACPPGFVSQGNVRGGGEIATCCLPGERDDVR